MKKSIFSTILFVISFSVDAVTPDSLEKYCELHENGIFKKNVRIDSFGLTTIINDAHYGFIIKAEGKQFEVILNEKDVAWGRDQFASTARMAKVLNLPVNICVDNEQGGFLLGIEVK